MIRRTVTCVFGRCERIRTSDPFVPNEVRYQAAPHTGFVRVATIPKGLMRANVEMILPLKPSAYSHSASRVWAELDQNANNSSGIDITLSAPDSMVRL